MHTNLLVSGFIIGFLIAAPVGPLGILCIRRTLTEGRACGLACGLGVAVADAIYACIAAVGVAFVWNVLIPQKPWINLLGGAFLCYLGIRIFRASPKEEGAPIKGAGLVGAFISTFFIAFANPMTTLYFMAIFAAFGIATANINYIHIGILVLGVFVGSALCWLIVSLGINIFRKRFNPNTLRWINRISGIIIANFGLILLMNF